MNLIIKERAFIEKIKQLMEKELFIITKCDSRSGKLVLYTPTKSLYVFSPLNYYLLPPKNKEIERGKYYLCSFYYDRNYRRQRADKVFEIIPKSDYSKIEIQISDWKFVFKEIKNDCDNAEKMIEEENSEKYKLLNDFKSFQEFLIENLEKINKEKYNQCVEKFQQQFIDFAEKHGKELFIEKFYHQHELMLVNDGTEIFKTELKTPVFYEKELRHYKFKTPKKTSIDVGWYRFGTDFFCDKRSKFKSYDDDVILILPKSESIELSSLACKTKTRLILTVDDCKKKIDFFVYETEPFILIQDLLSFILIYSSAIPQNIKDILQENLKEIQLKDVLAEYCRLIIAETYSYPLSARGIKSLLYAMCQLQILDNEGDAVFKTASFYTKEYLYNKMQKFAFLSPEQKETFSKIIFREYKKEFWWGNEIESLFVHFPIYAKFCKEERKNYREQRRNYEFFAGIIFDIKNKQQLSLDNYYLSDTTEFSFGYGV